MKAGANRPKKKINSKIYRKSTKINRKKKLIKKQVIKLKTAKNYPKIAVKIAAKQLFVQSLAQDIKAIQDATMAKKKKERKWVANQN